jgi:hypothetical protein
MPQRIPLAKLLAAIFLTMLSVRHAVAQTASSPAQPDCLVFRANPVGSDSMLSGTLTNQCGKAVMAYTLSVTVTYKDGEVSVLSGMGGDFLLGASGGGYDPSPGIGAIQPDEERPIGSWGISKSPNVTIMKLAAKVNSVIFDDATAIGDDGDIERNFSSRREDLREYVFWRGSLAVLKTKLSPGESLASIVDLAGVAQREQKFAVPHQTNRIRANADMMRSQLRALDDMVAGGRITREQALQFVEKLTASHVADFERNANRRTK